MSDLQWNRDFAMEQAGDDLELLEELLTMLVDSSKSDLAKIAAGLEAGDGDMVADAAHSIKGAAASLGVEGLRELSYEFEKSGRAGELEALDITPLSAMVEKLNTLKA